MTTTRRVRSNLDSIRDESRAKIHYRSIPDSGGGQVCLTIYPPGTFMSNTGFAVFVGGSGRGERKTLQAAKTYLLECAIELCDRRVNAAQSTLVHYAAQAKRLRADGLARLTQGKE